MLAFLEFNYAGKQIYIITHDPWVHSSATSSFPKKNVPHPGGGGNKVALLKKLALAATAFVCTTDSSRVGRVPRAQVLSQFGRKWWRRRWDMLVPLRIIHQTGPSTFVGNCLGGWKRNVIRRNQSCQMSRSPNEWLKLIKTRRVMHT